jgi:hypothetical protein
MTGAAVLAVPEDLPEDLRAIARRIPTESRLNQSVPELKARCEEVQGLLAQADTADDPDKARRLRKEADRMINGLSLQTFILAQGKLLERIGEASKVEGSYEAAHIQDELQKLTRDNPQPLEKLAGALLEAAAMALERQSAAKRPRWWKRNRS